MAISEVALIQVLRLIETSQALTIRVDTGDMTIAAAKGDAMTMLSPSRDRVAQPSVPVPQPASAPQPPAPQAKASPADPDPSGEDRNGHVVRAATAGTFYRAPSPGAAPFCQVGEQIGPEDTIGLVEVMKLFNSVSAGMAGTVAEFFVNDMQPVEMGQPLLLITPRT